MQAVIRHFTTSLLAGLVAILPIGGLIITIAYLESSISGAGLTSLPFYFPGLGILLVLLLIYLVGLVLTTFAGKWLWQRIDRLLHRLPALGSLYATLKQILGYGQGEDAMFQRCVLVPAANDGALEFGLVTNSVTLADGSSQLAVFVPGSPNPTSGRLILIEEARTRAIELPVSDALRTLVAAGKTELKLDA